MHAKSTPNTRLFQFWRKLSLLADFFAKSVSPPLCVMTAVVLMFLFASSLTSPLPRPTFSIEQCTRCWAFLSLPRAHSSSPSPHLHFHHRPCPLHPPSSNNLYGGCSGSAPSAGPERTERPCSGNLSRASASPCKRSRSPAGSRRVSLPSEPRKKQERPPRIAFRGSGRSDRRTDGDTAAVFYG